MFGLQVEGVAHHPVPGSLHAALHKLIVDAGLDVGPGARAAALALVEEQGEVGLLHRLRHWGERGVIKLVAERFGITLLNIHSLQFITWINLTTLHCEHCFVF